MKRVEIKELCYVLVMEIKIAKGYQEHKAYKGAAFEESGISIQDNLNPTIKIKELCFKQIKIAKGYQEHKAYKGAAFEESGGAAFEESGIKIV
ncbi:MAG: hypothetical protein IPL09_07170 [Bacteroidetes bacterium]|nr:hypothetical protein [Bacteroidota bacterium]